MQWGAWRTIPGEQCVGTCKLGEVVVSGGLFVSGHRRGSRGWPSSCVSRVEVPMGTPSAPPKRQRRARAALRSAQPPGLVR
jgi:hypothetical protein